ncbi:MAG: DegT/DnrJ/EryC1/StrS family aminotransferase [Candidatus Methanofastidiosia archaeon]|jgi:dTDP-4-amino-4,6-dideoxygalactose transaminase
MIKVSMPIVGEEEAEAVRQVLLSGRYVSGPKVKEFETQFSHYIGVDHAVAVNSGTAALHVTLAGLGVGPGDEVIVPPLTFFSTVTSVIHQNAVPVFADITESYCLDPEDFENKITDETKAVIPVHLFGYPAEMDAIISTAEEYGIAVIEDCAQAHGAVYKSKKVGSLGDVGCFSFYATKNMTTGEGGIITTDNTELADKARKIRNHGMTDRDTHGVLGYNYRMSEINAALGLVQLKKLDSLNEMRIKNSWYLLENLKDVPWLTIPVIEKEITHAFFWCPVRVKEDVLNMKTSELIIYLRENNIEVRHRYNKPLYRQEVLYHNAYPKGCPFTCPYYKKKIDYSSVYLPVAEKVAGTLIGLPNHPALTQEELDTIIDIFHAVEVNP